MATEAPDYTTRFIVPVSTRQPNCSAPFSKLLYGTMTDAIDLSGDGGVLKKIGRHAKPDAAAPTQDLPLVDGILEETGEVFDTTHEDNTIFSFEVGKGSVIKAWDIAVKTMKVGEITKITCKPVYAYGSAGSPPDIPPDATLVFEVELVACNPRKGLSLGSASEERARLEELKKQRELAAANKEEEKKKREEAKAAAAARIQAKLDAKKGGGEGKGKAK
ncbi:peptidyl-prolyl cis-trans isomerase FKBP20-1 [Pyrus ussuriensis x Pyrus communis]|uniref:peptidylprolyl isomerase n=1 Tax=Pyrus ussuriensis x Pyrus communis TaxID=2448454 RepID=A0A5N5F5C5_9ROSA|nr:peptidyl-prolyl cis-trans isomerase FKBP20-1 [Pyrus ussuriensis x Pyrus communis]